MENPRQLNTGTQCLSLKFYLNYQTFQNFPSVKPLSKKLCVHDRNTFTNADLMCGNDITIIKDKQRNREVAREGEGKAARTLKRK